MTWGSNSDRDSLFNTEYIRICVLRVLISLHANFIHKRQRRYFLYSDCDVFLNGLILGIRIVYGAIWEVMIMQIVKCVMVSLWLLANIAAFLLLACIVTR